MAILSLCFPRDGIRLWTAPQCGSAQAQGPFSVQAKFGTLWMAEVLLHICYSITIQNGQVQGARSA